MKLNRSDASRSGITATRVATIVVVLAAGAAAVWGYMRSTRPPLVEAVAVSRKDVVRTVIASGRVAPVSRVRIGSAVLGTVIDVQAVEGALVKYGEVLVRMDEGEALAAVDGARGSVLQAEVGLQSLREVIMPAAGEELKEADVDLEQAVEEYDRIEKLVQASAAGTQLLDKARTARDVARSRQARAMLKAASMAKCGPEHRRAVAAMVIAQASLDAATARVKLFTLRASSDAMVLRMLVEPGDLVQPGKPICELAVGGLELVVPVDEKNIAGIAKGVEAAAAADAFPDRPFAVRVASVAKVADTARGTIDVKMTLPKAPDFLVVDMTVTVEMKVERKKAAVVAPLEALRDAASTNPWVLVYENGTARRRDVRLGLRGDGFLEIMEGIAEGDRVLLPGKTGIRDGSAVRVRGD